MSASSRGPASPGLVSPLDASTNSTVGSQGAFSDKESAEPERGLFTITDEDRPPGAQSYYSPLAVQKVEQPGNHAQWSLDRKSEATGPEVVPTEKEMLHGQQFPAKGSLQPMNKEMSDKQAVEQSKRKDLSKKRWSRRAILIAIALLLVVVIGLSVGLGVGLGLKKNNSQSSQSNGSNSTDGSIIRSNSSIAAVESGTGDRFVFFQDGQNNIRWAGYSKSTYKWTATNTLATIIQPKPGSPIVAFVMPGSDLNTQSLIELIYIASNNSIIEIEVAPDKSVQTNVATDSRALIAAGDAMRMSVASSLRPGLNQTLDTFLMFRTTSTIGLWQRTDNRTAWSFGESWYDATSDLTNGIASSICEPFSADTFFSGTANGTQPGTLARFVTSNCDPTSPQILSSTYNTRDNTVTTSSSQAYSFGSDSSNSGIQADPAIVKSDWTGIQNAGEWYFVVEPSLKAFSLRPSINQTLPSSSFTSPHVTTLHYAFGSRTQFLYNQLDDATFAEHVYDAATKSWSTSSVNISELSTS